MGFLNKLKDVAGKMVKQLKYVEFELTAEELAQKWDKVKFYRPEVFVDERYSKYWAEINRVIEKEVEVGLFHKSKKTVVEIEYTHIYEEYEYEDDEEEGWWEERREIGTLKLSPKDKVKIRLTEMKYQEMLQKEGKVL